MLTGASAWSRIGIAKACPRSLLHVCKYQRGINLHTLAMDYTGLTKTQKVHIDALLEQCRTLHTTVADFRAYLAERRLEVDLSTYRNAVAAEVKSLERLSNAHDRGAEKVGHSIRSNNLPFLQAVWEAAKSCQGVTALSKRFFREVGTGRRKGALVDVVASEGREWIKVSTVSRRSLLYELAKQGWKGEDDDDDEEDGTKIMAVGAEVALTDTNRPNKNGSPPCEQREEDDDDVRIDQVKTVDELLDISRVTKVRYKHPRVRIVLPNVTEGEEAAVDGIIDTMRSSGATVHCRKAAPVYCANSRAIFTRMAPDPHSTLTSALNLDCTILLALISDLSHASLIPNLQARQGAINRQIAAEHSRPLLPSELYPALAGRDLHCASIAVWRMRDIVATIGTETEKLRADLLLGEGSAQKLAAKELIFQWEKYSERVVPNDVRLPIRIESAVSVDDGRKMLPPVEEVVGEKLSEINRGVF